MPDWRSPNEACGGMPPNQPEPVGGSSMRAVRQCSTRRAAWRPLRAPNRHLWPGHREWQPAGRARLAQGNVQALESSQFMSAAKEVFPHGTAAPQHGAELREAFRHLPERQEFPDLLHPRFPHQPRRRPQPLRASAGRQSAMQRLCRLRTVPGEVEIVSRDCGCRLHGRSISQPAAKGKAASGNLSHSSAHHAGPHPESLITSKNLTPCYPEGRTRHGRGASAAGGFASFAMAWEREWTWSFS